MDLEYCKLAQFVTFLINDNATSMPNVGLEGMKDKKEGMKDKKEEMKGKKEEMKDKKEEMKGKKEGMKNKR